MINASGEFNVYLIGNFLDLAVFYAQLRTFTQALQMRNLLGRLNAKSIEELTRIAAAWQVALPSDDRSGAVSRLYRALADSRTVRDVWDLLSEDERAMVRLLAVSEETALTVPELATHLDISEEQARETAARLYRKAILVREGDDDPLPVGSLPRLFLPRELTHSFRRIQDEIDAGDVSATPLRALLALFDDRELEETAEIWGVRVIPGLRGRDDLTRQILERVSDPDRIESVAAAQEYDASRIWQHLRNSEIEEEAPFSTAYTALELSPDDLRHVQRVRQALTELERSLLVWHTYRQDGSRWLFIPNEVRTPRRLTSADLPVLGAVLTVPSSTEPWRPNFALAWDLLTLLRFLSASNAPRVREATEFPKPWQRRLNTILWYRGEGQPPDGYLEFLVALGRAEGLIIGGNGPDDFLTVGPAHRMWRDRSFDDQIARLIWWWLANPRWIEGIGRDDIHVQGAEWVPFRRKLLVCLTALEPEDWYRLDQVASWLAERDPNMLGETFQVATARTVSAGGGGDTARRRAVVTEVASATLETSMSWLGLIENAGNGPSDRTIRLTTRGRAVATAAPLPPSEPLDIEKPLEIRADGTIELHDPSPLRVWSLSAFADVAQLERVSIYTLSESSIKRALSAGFEIRQIRDFLESQSDMPVPAEVNELLSSWSHGYRRVRLRRSILATPDDPELLSELQDLAVAHGFSVRTVGTSVLISEVGAEGSESSVDPLTFLRAGGFAPQWDVRPPASSRPRSLFGKSQPLPIEQEPDREKDEP